MGEGFDKARRSIWCSPLGAVGAFGLAAGVLIVFEDGIARSVVAGSLIFVGSVIVVIRLHILQFAEDRRGPRTCCPKCGYDLTGNASGTCPECGWVMPRRKAD